MIGVEIKYQEDVVGRLELFLAPCEVVAEVRINYVASEKVNPDVLSFCFTIYLESSREMTRPAASHSLPGTAR